MRRGKITVKNQLKSCEEVLGEGHERTHQLAKGYLEQRRTKLCQSKRGSRTEKGIREKEGAIKGKQELGDLLKGGAREERKAQLY